MVVLLTGMKTAGLLPKWTAVAPGRFVPVIATEVPPAVGPWLGDKPVTVGVPGDALKVKWSAEEVAEVPAALTTVISTVAAVWAGETARMDWSLTTTNDVALVAPNLTAVAPVNPEPPIPTVVPPAVVPPVGITAVTTGVTAFW